MKTPLRTIGLAGVVLLSACDGSGGPIELKFGHVGAPGSLFALSAEEFARRVNEELGERVHVSVFGSSQLGGDEVMMQKLKLGTLDFSLPSTIMSSVVPEFGLFEMPYLIASRDHMRAVEQEIVWPRLAPLAPARGYTLLAVWENGFRHVTNNVRPIVTPDDLRGIKLRTPRGVWRVKLFQTFGANPAPMPLSEVFVALQTGVIDGQENPFAQIWASRLQEVQQYLSLTRHVYTPAFVAVGTARWNRLPEDLRDDITRIARETQTFVYETAARLDRELLGRLEESGLEVNTPDYDAFRAASRPVYEEFGRAVEDGADLIAAATALRPGDGG